MAATRAKAAPKRKQKAAVTGQLADFPTLGMLRSHDVVCNMAWELHGRLVTFKWKQFLWGLRALAALGLRWRRHPRWLSNMFATEVASIWGHLGAATQALRGRDGPAMFR